LGELRKATRNLRIVGGAAEIHTDHLLLLLLLLLLLPRRYSPVGPRPSLMRLLNLTLIDN
jgi:hypothetical protein